MEEYSSPQCMWVRNFQKFSPLWAVEEELNALSLNSSICKITILIIKHL